MAYANFKPVIWTDIIERNFRNELVLGKLITDLSDRIATEGKAIAIPSFNAVAINDYTGAITTEEVADGKQELLINKAKYFSVKVDDVDAAQVKGDLINKLAANGAYQLANAFDVEIAKLHAKSNVVVTATAETVVSSIYALGAKMTKAGVPVAGRWLVVDPMTHAYIIEKMPTVSTGENSFGVAREAYVGRFGGFDIFVSNSIVEAAGVANCVAGVRASAAFATQIDKVRAMQLEGSFGDKVEGLNSYGVDVVETDLVAKKTDKLGVLAVTITP